MCVKRDCLKRDYRDYISVQMLGTKVLSTIFKTLLTICHVSLFLTARKNNLETIYLNLTVTSCIRQKERRNREEGATRF